VTTDPVERFDAIGCGNSTFAGTVGRAVE